MPVSADRRCGTCAWRWPHRGRHVCLHSAVDPDDARPADANTPGCPQWEAALTEADCGPCGACCREGFHRVELDDDDPAHVHTDVVQHDEYGAHLPRPGGLCVALRGGRGQPWRCRIYADRPWACRDFEVGGPACLEARQRVGLTAKGP